MRILAQRSALMLVIAFAAPLSVTAQDRQREVAERGTAVMPFTLGATTHVFSKTNDGGVQRVIAKSNSDMVQIRQVRAHLQQISTQFSRGDFSGPMQIHGAEMPGLAELRAAAPGQIVIDYRDLPSGAEIVYTSAIPALVVALHRWFDAQLADHGHDAMAGDDHAKHSH
jgi:isopropylmalate/homocitrate/citramalate synthase